MEYPLLAGESSSSQHGDLSKGFTRQKAAALVDWAEDDIGLPEQILDRECFQRSANYYFLAGESSSSQHGDLSKGFTRQKAAALVDLAEDGIGIPEQILDRESFQSSAKYYRGYMRFSFLWALLYFALLILNFLEKPLWCARYTDYTCSDREYYYLGQFPYLTPTESLIYEGITLIVLMVHTFFPISYEGFRHFSKSPLTQFKVVCLLILVADLLAYVLYLSPVAFDSLPFRVAPYIRVIFFILNFRELRSCMLILAGIFGTYLNALALGLLFLLFSSWLAYVMFEDTDQGTTVFTSYGTTLYQMFVLFTTSNNPDVWIPAYKASRWYCLFFVLYVLLGVYFVTNLILAVVYDSFKSQLKKQVSEMEQKRKTILEKAFHLIEEDNAGYIDKDQCIRLFEELNKCSTLPKISKEEFEVIFDKLDDNKDNKIVLDEFTYLCDAIALKFQEDTPSWFEKFPFYHSPFSKTLKAFIRSPEFKYTIFFILGINLCAVIFGTTLDIEKSSTQKVWLVMEFILGWVYVLEMALKVYSFGFENYWRDGKNRFDFLVALIIVIGLTLTFAAPEELSFLSNGEWIHYLLIASTLPLIRLLVHVQSYRDFITTFLTLIPSLMPYLGTIFCVMCIYCTLGVQIFGGIVNAGNANLEATDLYDNDYLLFNFNDYPNGMVTLFNLLVMGNWQAWMQSYKALTGTSWSLLYFISFYLITVLLLLNLVVAFVLEAFFAEMDLKVEGVKGRYQSGGSKSRSQRVAALLHHMFTKLNETQSSSA